MVGVGGTDETVVGDVHAVPYRLDGVGGAVHVLLGGLACRVGVFLDLLAVLVGAGEEPDVKAHHPLIAGDHIGQHDVVDVAHVGLAAGVGDGGGDVKLGFAHMRASFFVEAG